MGKKEFLKTVVFIIFLTFVQNFNAKEIINSDVTKKSYTFFCDSIMKNDSILASIDIYFDGIANKQVSDIFYIADCLNDISLIKDSIPNKKELNKLERKQKKSKINPMLLEIQPSLFVAEETQHSFKLIINSPVIYRNYIYQEYKLVNKYNEIRRVIIKIDIDSFEPIDYCTKSFIYG
ncbi:hypothetical protein [Dysgonomonas sp.]